MERILNKDSLSLSQKVKHSDNNIYILSELLWKKDGRWWKKNILFFFENVTCEKGAKSTFQIQCNFS